MRTYLITALFLAPSLAIASPGPGVGEQAEGRAKLHDEAKTFARQLHYLVCQVGDYYVKPLPAEDLYVAALTGLYQAARKPVPRDLRTQVRQAVNLASALRARSSPDLVIKPGDDPREQMLARLRDGIGNSLQGPAALRAACNGLLTQLDEHSALITVEEQRLTAGLDRYSEGVGLEFDDSFGLGPLYIETVHLGSPAQRVGLRPGDRITKVDDREISGVAPEKLLALRTRRVLDYAPPLVPADRQQSATERVIGPLRITYRRPGEDSERTATLMPEKFRPETVLGVRRKDNNNWEYLFDEKEKLAYIRITALNRGTSEDLQAMLDLLRTMKVRGLVLDLRWCPGGYLNESIRVADLFLGNGVIATEKSRDREDTVFRSAAGDKFSEAAIVVLVNSETSGGAELIAAALKDHGRASIIGQRTRGKASVQVPLEVGNGVALKLTKGTFVRPSGKNLHRFRDNPDGDWGVIPDEDFRLSPQLGKRLKEWHHLQALRPASSMQRLPLDDPTADTQYLAAIKALKARVQTKRR